MKKTEEKYMFAHGLNGTDQTGIVDISAIHPKLLCLCTEENSEIILKALSSPSHSIEETEAVDYILHDVLSDFWENNLTYLQTIDKIKTLFSLSKGDMKTDAVDKIINKAPEKSLSELMRRKNVGGVYSVWDIIKTKDGRIVQITSDDMSGLKYEDIERHATEEEVEGSFIDDFISRRSSKGVKGDRKDE